MNTALREKREAKKLTQAETAKKAVLALRTYLYYEYGERIPDVYAAQRIARAVNSTVPEIFPLPEEQLQDTTKRT